MRRLQQKFAACEATKRLCANRTKSSEGHVSSDPDPLQIATLVAESLQWPDSKILRTHRQRAERFMQQWMGLVRGKILNGTNHMQQAISCILDKVHPESLRRIVNVAARSGKLRDSDPELYRQWHGKSGWYCEAAMALVVDAANSLDKAEMGQHERARGAYDAVHLLRHHQWGDSMTAMRETRYTGNGTANAQYHATTTAFMPTMDNPSSDLSDEEILEMDNAEGSDAFPAQIIIDMIDNMLSTRCLLYTSPSPRD